MHSEQLDPGEQERRRREVASRANAFADEGRWELAVPLYREMLAEVTDDAEALRGLGLWALHAERPAEAVTWLLTRALLDTLQRADPERSRAGSEALRARPRCHRDVSPCAHAR
jgi:hypothetical protein